MGGSSAGEASLVANKDVAKVRAQPLKPRHNNGCKEGWRAHHHRQRHYRRRRCPTATAIHSFIRVPFAPWIRRHLLVEAQRSSLAHHPPAHSSWRPAPPRAAPHSMGICSSCLGLGRRPSDAEVSAPLLPLLPLASPLAFISRIAERSRLCTPAC